MRKALKRAVIALGVTTAVVTMGEAWLAAQPWGPPVELVDPGSGGTPIRLPELAGNFYPGSGVGRNCPQVRTCRRWSQSSAAARKAMSPPALMGGRAPSLS